VRDLLAKKRWTEAHAALEVLSGGAPLERSFLAWIAYARALEALDAGRVSEARRELVRATAIDPAHEPAKSALAELLNPVASRR
jgi:Tfp pilus assembly protein PilF